MDVTQAIAKARTILDEERILPTIDYIDPLYEWTEDVRKNSANAKPISIDVVKAMKGREKCSATHLNLYTERGMRPRPVHESPYDYTFKSLNFDLLKVLFSQIQESDRNQFISGLLGRIPLSNARRQFGNAARFPCYRHCMSELPLVAEFCIRMGFAQEFLKAVGSVEKPSIGLVILLLELEEIIALNFNLFSDQELGAIAMNLNPLSVLCQKIIAIAKTKRSQSTINYSHEMAELESHAKDILDSINGICEECRKGKYYYLKDSLLQEIPNLEIESDKTKVIGFLDSLGFDPLLTASLTRADELHRSSDAFVLKDCLGHVRSFYEHMTIGGGQAIAKSLRTTCLAEWDPTLTFLRNNSFLTSQQEKFARGLYTLLSDEGVHPLIAGREFARLLRNMVIEYGLMFLTMLEKKGVKV